MKSTLFFILSVLSTSAFGQNLWQATNGPCGGIIRATCLDSSGNIYLISERVFRSGDNGAHWTDITMGLPNVPLSMTAMTSGAIVVTGNIESQYETAGPTFISTDKGATWTKILDAPSKYARVSLVASSSNNILYAWEGDSIHTSSDFGTTWKDR